MKSLRSLLATVFIISAVHSTSSAEETPTPPSTYSPPSTPNVNNNKFEKHKAEVLAHLNEKDEDIKKFKTCIENSKDHEDMAKCRKENRGAIRHMRESQRQHRMDRIKDQSQKNKANGN